MKNFLKKLFGIKSENISTTYLGCDCCACRDLYKEDLT